VPQGDKHAGPGADGPPGSGDPRDAGASEQWPSARDQAAIERDRAAAERDQAAANRDHTASDRDQSQADGDQRTSDREDATAVRDQAAADRGHATADRDLTASDRDQSQVQADQRTSHREWATADRSRAAADREDSAADRVAATHDREQARVELRHAQFDPLTGAYGRELGLVVLDHEISRARRASGRLVIAYVDVNGLKQVNDQGGHGAGDELLRAVVAAIRANVRPYDPTVRIGGDEFVCALGNAELDDAHRRFADIRASLDGTDPGASISVGFAALGPDDTLEQLIERGDQALYEAKRSRRPPD